jgi:ribosomal protein L37AE/L43A
METAAGARSLRCERCHAAFSLAQPLPEVHCPFCGHRQAVPAYDELKQHELAVNERIARAQHELGQAAAFEAWRTDARSDPKRTTFLLVGVGFVAPLLIWIATSLAPQLGLPLAVSESHLVVGVIFATYIALLGYVIWQSLGRQQAKDGHVDLEGANVACPNCGAAGVLSASAAVDTCGYCQAALIPTRTAMHRAVSDAQAALREATLARHREERLVALRTRSSMVVPLVLIGPGVALPFIVIPVITVGATWDMATGQEPFNGAVLLGWGMSAAIVGGAILWWRRRQEILGIWARATATLSRQFNGHALGSAAAVVQWMNQHWAGPYDLVHLRQGSFRTSLALSAAGYPVLLAADPFETASKEQSEQRALKPHVLLAAWVPGVSDHSGQGPARGAAVEREVALLSAAGFEVAITEAGLFAHACLETTKALRKHPAAAHALAVVIGHLTQLAQALGAAPPKPALPTPR